VGNGRTLFRTFILSVEEAARRCLVGGQTLYNWLRELAQNPAATTIGALLRPQPPSVDTMTSSAASPDR
jgi:hypothetical protein